MGAGRWGRKATKGEERWEGWLGQGLLAGNGLVVRLGKGRQRKGRHKGWEGGWGWEGIGVEGGYWHAKGCHKGEGKGWGKACVYRRWWGQGQGGEGKGGKKEGTGWLWEPTKGGYYKGYKGCMGEGKATR